MWHYQALLKNLIVAPPDLAKKNYKIPCGTTIQISCLSKTLTNSLTSSLTAIHCSLLHSFPLSLPPMLCLIVVFYIRGIYKLGCVLSLC
jgi:hypothetical protein